MSPMISNLITIVVAIVLGGVADFLIQRAPFLAEPYKAYARYAILVVVVIVIVVVLLRMIGMA